jgi:glycosyltransferase involved in cell wall biosynthesis
VNPYPSRLPRWDDLTRRRGLNEQGTALDSRVEVLDVPALPIEPLPSGAWLNRRLLWRGTRRRLKEFIGGASRTILGIGRPNALALLALENIPHDASFFDAMDNFPEFHQGLSRRSAEYYEDAVAAEVDLVLASSSFLTDKFTRRGLRVEKVANGYPMSSLDPRPAAPRSEMVLGYVGCISSWFDWPLVVELARRLPSARIELVGPRHVEPPWPLPANIRFFPPCRQSESVEHLSRFSAGLIPFQNNILTAGVDPVKYYEYRAAGLPVLSTSFGEMALRSAEDGVFFLDQGGDLASAVETAVRFRHDPAATAQFRRDHDWRRRFIVQAPFDCLLNDYIRKRTGKVLSQTGE